ncbi:hypothetical protein ACFSJY_19255 [Thalassotalea euphylliae]|uniref:hypothetical protein n=1 Tax=Thalassotalea euphylliae TaxID=1655234 RepID=UPI00362B7536
MITLTHSPNKISHYFHANSRWYRAHLNLKSSDGYDTHDFAMLALYDSVKRFKETGTLVFKYSSVNEETEEVFICDELLHQKDLLDHVKLNATAMIRVKHVNLNCREPRQVYEKYLKNINAEHNNIEEIVQRSQKDSSKSDTKVNAKSKTKAKLVKATQIKPNRPKRTTKAKLKPASQSSLSKLADTFNAYSSSAN